MRSESTDLPTVTQPSLFSDDKRRYVGIKTQTDNDKRRYVGIITQTDNDKRRYIGIITQTDNDKRRYLCIITQTDNPKVLQSIVPELKLNYRASAAVSNF